jgi:hypothetical protein
MVTSGANQSAAIDEPDQIQLVRYFHKRREKI